MCDLDMGPSRASDRKRGSGRHVGKARDANIIMADTFCVAVG